MQTLLDYRMLWPACMLYNLVMERSPQASSAAQKACAILRARDARELAFSKYLESSASSQTHKEQDIIKFLTGYAVSKLVNSRLEGAKIPPQMIYNYMSQGLIESEVHEGQRVVRAEGAEIWCDAFVTKRNLPTQVTAPVGIAILGS